MGFRVAGFRAEEIVGFGAAGEVWRGVRTGTGRPVALKRLRVGADADQRRRLRREAALLAALQHPHLLRLHELVEDGTEVVLVLDLIEGGSLGGLLARRHRLTAGEVVTALAPVCEALAHAHAHGVVHGDVSPGNVLLTAEGCPVLADLGTARLLGEDGAVHATPGCTDPDVLAGAVPGPASDVYSVAALAVLALTGCPAAASVEQVSAALRAAAVPEALQVELLRCLDPMPARRPGAGALARALLAAVPAEPLRAVASTPGVGAVALTHLVAGRSRPAPAEPATAQRTGRHRSPERRRPALPVVAVAVLLLVALAVGAGVFWAAEVHGPDPVALPDAAGAGRSTTVTTAAGWAAVLGELDSRRGQAFRTDDVTALQDVYAERSPLLVADAALLQQLAERQEHAAGMRHQILGVAVLGRSAQAVSLRVRDTMSSYQVVAADGQVVQSTAARGPQTMQVRLVRSGRSWRIATMARCP